VINAAGYRDPTMNWVRVNLRGYGPEPQPRDGYSDGQDVGPAWEYQKQVYRWGKNVAQGRPYTASRPASDEARNGDTGGRELTNGAIIAPTDDVASEAVQAATAFWHSGEPVTFVLDLGRRQRLAGACVSSHQPNAEYCHPERVDVAVSDDGENWLAAGTIHHHDLWKPPADYEPWEHDDDPSYEGLPAAGRLAYSYPLVLREAIRGRYVRFTCTPLPNRGLGLSELEVFDQVDVMEWPESW
jgi:hypothetical protein